MRPHGRGGSRSLQDLLTDAKVPRAARESVPIVEEGGGRIAWVPGIAVGEGFVPPPDAPPGDVVALAAAVAAD